MEIFNEVKNFVDVKEQKKLKILILFQEENNRQENPNAFVRINIKNL